MAYLTDVKYLPEEEYAKLEGLDVLILTALRRGAHPTHESLEEPLLISEGIKPKETYLIHMSHRIGLHAEVEKELPPHVHLPTTDYTFLPPCLIVFYFVSNMIVLVPQL